MDFDEFWRRLSAKLTTKLTSQNIKTLGQSHMFGAVMTGPSTLRILTITGDNRTIKRKEFEQMWDVIKDKPKDKRYVSFQGHDNRFKNRVYVRTLISDIVDDRPMQ